MDIFQGLQGFGTIAIGKIKVINRTKTTDRSEAFDSQKELEKFEVSKQRVISILQDEHDKISHNIDGEGNKTNTINSQLMLIQDHQLEDAIIGRILTQKCKVDVAINGAGAYFYDVMSKQKDGYIRGKAGDMKELTRRLLSNLDLYDGADIYLDSPCIIAAHTLKTSEFLQLDKTKVIGLIIEQTSSNSHTAILAKAMGIPTILGCEIDDTWENHECILDGSWRVVYVDPDDGIKSDMQERLQEMHRAEKELEAEIDQETVTIDGHKIRLMGNIASGDSYDSDSIKGCEGIGLCRTESTYLNRTEAPTENELFEEYRKIISLTAPNKIIIRTVDICMDKEFPYLHNQTELNSALGCRGIRLCLRFTDLFKTQLRALLRASVYGNVSVMFPMISSVKEFRQCLEIVDECKRELIAADIPFKEFDCGAMIETPASVMISDDLAKYAKFLSIGTNDLTQYTLGVDRENKDLEDVCDYHHPAILRMIKMVVDNGHKYHIPVGICGELASDHEITPYFLQIGVDSLSIAPINVLSLRNQIRKMDLSMILKE